MRLLRSKAEIARWEDAERRLSLVLEATDRLLDRATVAHGWECETMLETNPVAALDRECTCGVRGAVAALEQAIKEARGG